MNNLIIAILLSGQISNYSIEEQKNAFLDSLSCKEYGTMYSILNCNPKYWTKRFKNAKRVGYQFYDGSIPLWYYNKKEVKQLIEKAKKYGVELE